MVFNPLVKSQYSIEAIRSYVFLYITQLNSKVKLGWLVGVFSFFLFFRQIFCCSWPLVNFHDQRQGNPTQKLASCWRLMQLLLTSHVQTFGKTLCSTSCDNRSRFANFCSTLMQVCQSKGWIFASDKCLISVSFIILPQLRAIILLHNLKHIVFVIEFQSWWYFQEEQIQRATVNKINCRSNYRSNSSYDYIANK